MNKHFILFLGAFLLLAGCSGNKKASTSDTSRNYYDASYNLVWQAALNALDKKGLPVLTADRNDGIIQTDVNSTDRYTLYTFFNTKDTPCVAKRFAADVRIKEKRKGLVKVIVKAYGSCSTADTAEERSAKQNLTWKDFSSTGQLEKEIVAEITAQMPPASWSK